MFTVLIESFLKAVILNFIYETIYSVVIMNKISSEENITVHN
jgi:hypothetical protein